MIAADWMMPPSTLLDRSRLLRRVRFVVIRSSDIATLSARFGVTDARFVPFPAPGPSGPATDGDYVYSGGWAHRDWATLLAALAETEAPAVISAGVPLVTPPNVEVVQQLTPEAGRERMRSSRLVALTFNETSLPSGPTVLLDAMADGKAIVVTDVGGSRTTSTTIATLWSSRRAMWQPSPRRSPGSGRTRRSGFASGRRPVNERRA